MKALWSALTLAGVIIYGCQPTTPSGPVCIETACQASVWHSPCECAPGSTIEHTGDGLVLCRCPKPAQFAK